MTVASNSTFGLFHKPDDSLVIKTAQKLMETSPISVSKDGVRTQNLQPYFKAYQSGFLFHETPLPNSITDIFFDAVTKNVGNHFDPIASTFTAPTDGRYLFNADVRFTAGPDSFAQVALRLLVGNTPYDQIKVVDGDDHSGEFTLSITQQAMMEAGQVAKVMFECESRFALLGLDSFLGVNVPRTHFEGRFIG